MKKFKLFSLAFAALLSFGSLSANAQSLSPNTKWHWNKGKIVIETPERPAGQKDVLGLALPKMKTVRVGKTLRWPLPWLVVMVASLR